MSAQGTPLNRGMGSWFNRVLNKNVKPHSLFVSDKLAKRIRRMIKQTENDTRLNGYHLPNTFGDSI